MKREEEKALEDFERFFQGWKRPDCVIGTIFISGKTPEIHLRERRIREQKSYNISLRDSTDYPYEISFIRNGVKYFALLQTLNEKETEQWQRAGFQTLPAVGTSQSIDFEEF